MSKPLLPKAIAPGSEYHMKVDHITPGPKRRTRCSKCRMRRKVSRFSGQCSSCDNEEKPPLPSALARNSSSSPPLPVPMDRAAQMRVALMDTFTHAHSTHIETAATRHVSLFTNILKMDPNASPLLRAGLDTLFLTHLAQSSNSEDITARARTSFGRFCYMLRDAVDANTSGKVLARANDVDVVESMMLLGGFHWQDDAKVFQFGDGSFGTQWSGIRNYLDIRGPKALDWSKERDRVIFLGLKNMTVFDGIASGDLQMFQGEEWNDHLAKARAFSRSLMDWRALLHPLPDLMKRIETAPTDSKAAHSLFHELDDIRQKFLPWMPDACEMGVVRMSDDSQFDFSIEEHCFITTSNTFSFFHRFKSLQQARNSLLSWTIGLVVECSLIRLVSAHPTLRQSADLAAMKMRAYCIARDLCRGVWHIAPVPAIAFANFLHTCVSMAQIVFEQWGTQAQREYGWTQACLLATEVRMARLRNQGKKSICAFKSLVPGMKTGCRWSGISEGHPIDSDLVGEQTCPVTGHSLHQDEGYDTDE